MFAKLRSLWIAGALCLVTGAANAELLMPLEIGTIWEYRSYHESDPDNPWTMRAEVLEEVTKDSEDYFHAQLSDESSGRVDDRFIRSTPNAVYGWRDGTSEYLLWQTGVGTTWTYPDPAHPSRKISVEIMPFSHIEVPYGEFDDAYHHHKISSSRADSNDFWEWDEYIVPGLGMVMMADQSWDGSLTYQKLVRVVP